MTKPPFSRMPRRQPPWWPQNEPWPPQNSPEHWRRMQRRFIVAAGIAAAVVIFLAIVVGTIAFLFIASGLGWINWEHITVVRPGMPTSVPRPIGNGGGPPRFAIWWGIIVLSFLVMMITGAFQRISRPLSQLVVASSRVEAGDYSVRVDERGPRSVRNLARSFNAMVSQLQASDERRRAMLADVTHELRTPLTVIQGNLEGLIDGLYPRDDAHLQPILDETHVIARLIEDLRILSLAEAGMLKLQREQTDLGDLINDVLSSFRAKADEAGVLMRAEVDSDVPLLDIDAVRVREVIVNLISNALRYTADGGQITVEAKLLTGRVKVSVSDTGRGIAPDVLPHVFDRFYKGRDSIGTGLGLAIAKQLIAAHGGDIVAESTPGEGTRISFDLPTTFRA